MEMDLKKYMGAIRKRFWIILLLSIAASCSAYAYSKQMEPSFYSANVKIIVNKTVEAVGGETMDVSSIASNIKLIETYKEIILTPAIMDKVVELHPELNLSSAQLISRVRVNALNETQVMSLNVTDTNYARAARTVNAVSEVFRMEIPKIMKINNVTILTSAREDQPTQPFGQNTKSNVTVALFAALLLSTGAILLIEYFDQSIKKEEDVLLAIGSKTLAVVPRMKKRDIKLPSSNSYAASQSGIKAGEQAL